MRIRIATEGALNPANPKRKQASASAGLFR